MTETEALEAYGAARSAYDASPSYPAAVDVQTAARRLVQISDDYQEYADEADDIIADHP